MNKRLTAETINASSKCPDCGRDNRLNLQALADSDHRVYQRWLVCGHCGWDQRGPQYAIAVGSAQGSGK